MNWTICIIICSVALALWILATIGEHTLLKKRQAANRPKKPDKEGVFYGNREYNEHKYKQF